MQSTGAQVFGGKQLEEKILKEWERLQREHGEQSQAHLEAFAHVYGAALTADLFGGDKARQLGDAREQRTWPRDGTAENGRRGTYADAFNNEIGIAIARGTHPDDVAKIAYEAVTDGTAVVQKGTGFVRQDDGSIIKDVPYDSRIPAGVNDHMTLPQIQSDAKDRAARYLETWRTLPAPQPLYRKYQMLK